MTLLHAVLLAFRQCDDPAFRRPLWRAAAAAAACFALLFWLALRGAAWLAAGAPDWLAGPMLDWAAQALGGLLALLLAGWLLVPALVTLAGLFADPVAAAVERRHYPHLPPPAGGASIAAQIGAGLRLGARLLVLHLVLIPVALLLPGVGAALAFLVGAWGLGAGLFESVAMRRMGTAAARAERRRRRLSVLGLGALGVLAAAVPLLNLLVPVIGTAAATHLLHRGARRAGDAGAGGNWG
ncbi:EI24 domain-containing protein [Caldovatus aquaticus]|uniref:EI24 domain-containing protein n=1 Tax=Caldovatus aquaticus TaxID=2865671 RepID=A0ABS7F3Y6_9PROT|nr:EI24 domain-containing protein [Caldovatus aquaticus]MBW8270248.1 EI24 domain-containing protein [Caldovatus aquaticus]